MNATPRLPGLDGLRGVAVLAVIGYHLDLGTFFPAGFLGVDIFFTVSGFIITALLLREHERSGSIDLLAFYQRRARRLVPAALTMLLVVVALTPWLLPSALPRLREDLPAALLYLSNWWQIAEQQSYFEAIEQPRLLKHLWSLAVEEQYYLLWPLLSWWLLDHTRRLGLGLTAVCIALASTAWMAWLYVTQIAGGDPSRLYLGTDTHLMGLLTGSALATLWNPWTVHTRQPTPATPWGLNLMGTAALAALVGAMAFGHEGMAWLYQGGFLGVALLTAVVIVAATRQGTWVAGWLSTRPMQWWGSRSYSLYLWHWPVVVALSPSPHAGGAELAGVTAARLAITLVLAELSYRWVETAWASSNKASAESLAAQASSVQKTEGGKLTAAALRPLPVELWRRAHAWTAMLLVLVNVGVLGLMPGLVSRHSHEHNASAAGLVTKPEAARSAGWTSSWPIGPLTGGPAQNADRSPRVTLVGDSVLLGASAHMLRYWPPASASVEAKVGRQGSDGLKLVQSLREQGQLGDAAVIHLGTNGYLNENQFRALLAHLADRQWVVVLNVYGARRWTQPNNALLAQVTAEFDHVRLVDWHAIGQANPGYFVQDGIHLSGAGIRAYDQHIRQALGLPTMAMNPPATQTELRPLKPRSQPSQSPPATTSAQASAEKQPQPQSPPWPAPQVASPLTSPLTPPIALPTAPQTATDVVAVPVTPSRPPAESPAEVKTENLPVLTETPVKADAKTTTRIDVKFPEKGNSPTDKAPQGKGLGKLNSAYGD